MREQPGAGAGGGGEQKPGAVVDFARFADPLPQALVLTAIVISFATTALLLVVLVVARGLTGTDHVDGQEPDA